MSDPIPSREALILGATGGVGGAVARALLRRGWRVRALTRSVERARGAFPDLGAIDWRAGDALNGADVADAARGVALIFHGVHPPGYRNWRGLCFPMLRNTIEAARRSGARILFPGTIYNYGPDAGSVLSETSPQNPLTRKGRIRVEMEAMLAEAAPVGVRSLIVRAGDFFGHHAPSSWFNQLVVRVGTGGPRLTYPGSPEVGHAWAYLPDLAETFADLMEREADLGDFETFHFEGHHLDRGIAIAETARAVLGRPDLPIHGLPWIAVYLAAPFVTFLREMIEMRYLWRVPLRLDNAKLVRFLGRETRTPLAEAIRQSLAEAIPAPVAQNAAWEKSGTSRSAAIL